MKKPKRRARFYMNRQPMPIEIFDNYYVPVRIRKEHMAAALEDVQEIGSRFKNARLAKNISLEELEKMSEIPRQVIEDFETGNPKLGVSVMVYLARCIDLDGKELFKGFLEKMNIGFKIMLSR